MFPSLCNLPNDIPSFCSFLTFLPATDLSNSTAIQLRILTITIESIACTLTVMWWHVLWVRLVVISCCRCDGVFSKHNTKLKKPCFVSGLGWFVLKNLSFNWPGLLLYILVGLKIEIALIDKVLLSCTVIHQSYWMFVGCLHQTYT